MFGSDPSAYETGSLAAEIESTSPMLTVKWIFEHQVVVFELYGNLIQNAVVDSWYTAVKRVIEGWDARQPYLAVHDTRGAQFHLSPHLSARSRSLFALRPELPRYVAVITPRTFVTQLLSAWLRAYRRDKASYGVYFSTGEAVRSLLPYLKHAPSQ
jgi:hypothetical protein